MSNKKVVKISALDYYFVGICGGNGHHVFIKEADNAYFLFLLKILLKDNETVELAAYCLLNDRIDLLFHQVVSSGVAKFMHSIIVDYNKYYFDKYGVEDVLSEGRYKASKVLAKDILKESRKIHTNLDDWINYRYSSLRAYLYNDTPDWLTKSHISDLYGSAVKYFDFLNSCDEE